jgi:hypothetical protein
MLCNIYGSDFGQPVLDDFIFCIYLFLEKSTSKAAAAATTTTTTTAAASAAVNTKWEISRAI